MSKTERNVAGKLRVPSRSFAVSCQRGDASQTEPSASLAAASGVAGPRLSKLPTTQHHNPPALCAGLPTPHKASTAGLPPPLVRAASTKPAIKAKLEPQFFRPVYGRGSGKSKNAREGYKNDFPEPTPSGPARALLFARAGLPVHIG